MWYLFLYVPVAIWIYIDSKRRLYEPGKWWAIATALIGPLTAPVYFAKRPLKKGETREGGLPWNVLKNFALFWTLTLCVGAIGGMMSASNVMDEATNEYKKAGAAVGTAIGLAMVFALWFFPMVGAIMLGVFLKKSNLVEEGPTGPLIGAEEADYGLKNFVGDAKARSLDAFAKAKTLANDIKTKQAARTSRPVKSGDQTKPTDGPPPIPPTA